MNDQSDPLVTKHPEAIAWDRYAEVNVHAFDSSTLGAINRNNSYLRNRIQRAFNAGIEFQKTRYRKPKSTKP